jgi:BolA protein
MSESRAGKLERCLRQRLTIEHLEIEDQSHLHAGHAGARDGKSHFRIVISAREFAGRKPMECHRLVYEAADDLLKTDIHALSIRTRPPAQPSNS